MRLSEAMRLGFTLAPPSLPRKWRQTVTGLYNGACPELAAGLAVGLNYNQAINRYAYDARFPLLAVRLVPTLNPETMEPEPPSICVCSGVWFSVAFYGEVISRKPIKPEVRILLRHLYDSHQFTRDQVADWIESLENRWHGELELPVEPAAEPAKLPVYHYLDY